MSCIDWQALSHLVMADAVLPALPDTHDTIAVLSTFALIAGAEIGDKSQLVCMTLTARHRGHGWAVFAGSTLAFWLLNAIAVVAGSWVLAWIPHDVLAIGVILLFTLFGVRSLLDASEEEHADAIRPRSHSVFFSSFALLFLAELGDKTQLSVAALSTELKPWIAWTGASLALTLTTAMAVILGFRLLKHIPLTWIHRAGGVLFLGFAAFLLVRLLGEHQLL
ncbi:MAG: hypothetical protein RIQ52_1730 [Pseudomonadota bacterium]|jgi:putative Ca2+/H+ antiporter (TMEM165/GDT1 family)